MGESTPPQFTKEELRALYEAHRWFDARARLTEADVSAMRKLCEALGEEPPKPSEWY